MREQDYSTPRVSRHRRHEEKDHSECSPNGNCREARELDYLNEEHLLALAAFEELAERGIDARAWWGDGYIRARELANAELPDYDYLPREPDSIHRLQVKHVLGISPNA